MVLQGGSSFLKESVGGLAVDYPMLIVTLVLVLIGLICLYSATAENQRMILKTSFGKQVIWFFVGILVFLGVLFSSLQGFYRSAYLFYGIFLVLLLLVLFFGLGRVHRWIGFGHFRFQPSELAKVATVLAVARYLSQEKGDALSWMRFLGAIGLVIPPTVLILKQPDVGTACVFLAILVVMIVWAGLRLKMTLFLLFPLMALASGFHVICLVGFIVALVVGLLVTKQKWWVVLGVGGICSLSGLVTPMIWSKLEPYQQQRMLIFLGIKSDPHGAAYQVIQSKIAIGSGGVLGKGFLHGSQTQLRFLPEQHTDFIFSVLGEEFGFIGVIVVLGLFLFLISRMFLTARMVHNRFASLVAVGCVAILAFQFVINVGMTVELVPVTGLPLPFLSYGGSSLLMALTLVGLTANVSSRRYKY